MKLESDKLVIEFYNKKSSEFPGITQEQAKDICYGPWKFLKEEMENGTTDAGTFTKSTDTGTVCISQPG